MSSTADGKEPIRILLIEDDLEDQLLLGEMITDIGASEYKVIEASSLETAQALLDEHPFDIILLDLGLPDSIGLETLLSILSKVPLIPIIVLTGLDDDLIGDNAVSAGAQDYLVKGKVTNEELRRSIRYSIQRKHSENIILNIQNKSKEYLNIAGVMLLVLDAKGNVTLINRKGCEILGYAEEELRGSDWFDTCLPERMKTEVRNVFSRLMEGESVGAEEYENPIVTKQGDELLISWHNTILKDENGIIIGTLSSGEDITEMRAMELTRLDYVKKLHFLQRQLKTIVQENPDGILVLDKNGVIVFLNPEIESLMGMQPSELIGTSFDYPVDGTDLSEIDLSPTKGKRCIAELRTVSIEWEGDEATLVVLHDITERIIARERRQLVAGILRILNRPSKWKDLIGDILALIKRDTGFEAVAIRLKEGEDYPYFRVNGFPRNFIESERFLCARDQHGDIIRDEHGNVILECMCGNVIRGRTDALKEFFTERGSFWTNSTTDFLMSTTTDDRQGRTRNQCNSEGYESVALVPLSSGEEIIGLLQFNDRRKNMFTRELIHFFEELGQSIGIAFKRKQIEEELVMINREYESKNLQLEQIMYVSSHDIRSPLVNVLGFGKELMGSISELRTLLTTTSPGEDIRERAIDIIDGEVEESIDFIKQNIKKIDKLNTGILTYSRLGSVDMDHSNVDIAGIVQEIISEYSSKINENSITISLGELPDCVADRKHMKTVISNLLDNALKYITDERKCIIEISGTIEDDSIVYRIQDNGIGIGKKYLDTIFDLFHQLNPLEDSGSGLGLALSHRILDRHHGKIWVESEPGKGSTFFFSVPKKFPRGNGVMPS